MVEVFKTDIDCECVAEEVRLKLNQRFPESIINFDLEDCDRVLRIEAENICISEIKSITQKLGIFCEVLE